VFITRIHKIIHLFFFLSKSEQSNCINFDQLFGLVILSYIELLKCYWWSKVHWNMCTSTWLVNTCCWFTVFNVHCWTFNIDINAFLSQSIHWDKFIHSRVRVIVFKITFNNISVISLRSVLLMEEIGVPRENHRSAASHWQTLSLIMSLSSVNFSKVTFILCWKLIFTFKTWV
jgi:hypothetical protein